MTTFAHIENGYVIDPYDHATIAEYKSRFGALADQWVIVSVPSGTVHGAKDNGDGTFTNPPPPPLPGPNNPGNPYFGKKPIATKDFYAIAGRALGARYARLRKDDAFLWIADLLGDITLVDPDDKAGQFLQIIGYLETTNAADGQPLMSPADVAAIMALWP